jgi:hypothetical protein
MAVDLEARSYEPDSVLLLEYPKFISEDGETIVGSSSSTRLGSGAALN